MRVKRLIDIAVSLGVLITFAPLLLLIAAAVVAGSGRPMLFSQVRLGRGFRRFRIYKFRTMHAGHSGAGITVGGDARITRVGRFLRASKLDELPQFWNVLRGEMSLVGPRPEVPEYVDRFRDRYRRILTVRPGITDLASLRYRNEERILALSRNPMLTYVEEILPAKLDLAEEYLRRRSLRLDLSILIRTVQAAFRVS
jgi:lipopolysaccharide/colanic/teichoic acid biosynthesis glycosyltransferase